MERERGQAQLATERAELQRAVGFERTRAEWASRASLDALEHRLQQAEDENRHRSDAVRILGSE
eukprot:5453410-Alexandrium_andersonii.AAC.1